ncbi:hypothetical protein GLOTRDRAFT_76332 [Gloeophyllum trabeum ATCC 11539]|uniref:PinX1-related protein 1 n=1 Tax=Gloeophyllum trabeum (strain ATCC 11539 / FP-39264 / Madison 617) TaxID=670483 RepID=S7Q6H1_GLOTA|nr:uncharacterized protein GLOTRDRAFT_76332 [Gloeophyllum trabeum ATCC 11539]EPQ55013.1 hypothetical protein GLOTRDRAFT_76332 [Gloeophyllum trabeum ATCC 11539]
MGLSGRKEKQRIPHDPRNLSWADNAAKFGQAYLQKFGWDTSKGLGANSDGRTSHIKVSQKLDMMGIGAQHQKDPNGIAWKQNNDFERLLRRLNASGDEAGALDDENAVGTKVAGFAKAGNEQETEEVGEKRKTRDEDDGQEKRKKKKKRRADDESVGVDKGSEVEASENEGHSAEKREERRKRDKEGKREKSGKKRKEKKEKKGEREGETEGGTADMDEKSPSTSASSSSTAPVSEKKAGSVRPLAHRARLIRHKRMAYQDAAAVSEILGLSRSASMTASQSPMTPAEVDSVLSPNVDTLHLLTTSSKSVMDYFKEKLLAKSGTPTPTGSRPDTPLNAGIGMARRDEDDAAPRMGLGGAKSMMSMFTSASSSVPLSHEPSGDDQDSVPRSPVTDVAGDEDRGSCDKAEAKKRKKKDKKEKKNKQRREHS